MARSKQVSRRLPRTSTGETGEGSGSSENLHVRARRRRYQSHAAVLRELRQIERHMQPAVPRLPFQRLVREVCEQWRIGFRWTPSAILTLQEITEDFLIEFFEDAYLLAAFTHRLTVMPRDFDVLRRIRYRYDQVLRPVLVNDRRMHEILTVPPLHPRAREVEPSFSVHNRDTRLQARRRGVETEPQFQPSPLHETQETQPQPQQSSPPPQEAQAPTAITEPEPENINAEQPQQSSPPPQESQAPTAITEREP